jgi:hypothetical protein
VAMERGNNYDDYFCNPGEAFFKKYKLFKGKMPNDKIVFIVEQAYQYVVEHLINPNSMNYYPVPDNQELVIALNFKPLYDIIVQTMIEIDYQSNWKVDTRYNKIVEEGEEYFKFLMDDTSKKAIAIKDYTLMQDAIERIENDPIIGATIRAIRHGNIPNIEVKFQAELYTDSLGIKGKLDILVLNHKAKTATVFDIKTAKNPNTFKINYYKYRYDIQGSMYKRLAAMNCPEDYTVMDTKFIVIYTDSTEPAFILGMTQADTELAELGGRFYQQGDVRGWHDIVKEIHWQIDNKTDFLYPKAYYEQKMITPAEIYKNAIVSDFKD